MYSIYFVNHGYASSRQFGTFGEAVAFAKQTCFEVTIARKGSTCAAWSPISGLNIWR